MVEIIRSTTVIVIRKNGQVVMAGDGQVTMGETVVKHQAKKIRRLYHNKILTGFAGSTADAFTLFERLEAKLEQSSKTQDVEMLVGARELASSLNPRGGSAALSKLDEGSLRLQLKVLLALAAARKSEDSELTKQATLRYLAVQKMVSEGSGEKVPQN